jgi:outer membrane receptor for ferric coprogen and ferric-rhodotorulic acid
VGTTNIVALARDYEETSLALDAHYVQPFRLFGQTHSATVGADYRRYEQTMRQGNAGGFTDPMNVYAPDHGIAEPSISYTTRTESDPTQYGVYGQLRLKPIDRLTTIVGARTSWYESTTTNLVTGSSQDTEVDAEVVPYVGVVFDLTDSLSAYASYTEIFQPQTDLDASGNVIDPRTGTQYEVGLKASFLNGRLNASTGLFKLIDKNRAVSDPSSPGSSVANGEVESRGFEAEVSGRILDGWEVFAGYAYTETEIIKATTTSEGQPFSSITPEHSANLWTKYTFDGGTLDGLWVAGGGRAVGAFYNQVGSVKIEEDGYLVVDAQVGYRLTENAKLSFTVNNLFDEEYYSRVGGLGLFNFYGEPRSYLLKLTASF